MGDQIALLKGATFEVMQIRFNMVFNTRKCMWECGHITYCIDDAVRGETTYANKGQSVLVYFHRGRLDLFQCENVEMSTYTSQI